MAHRSFFIGLHFLLALVGFPIVAAEAPPALPSLALSGPGVVPTVRSNPDYPIDALNLRLEGWVVVSFSVVPGGATADVIALRSSDPGFEPGAVRAVSRWKYELPAETLGARGATFHTVIRFSIDSRPDNGRTAFKAIFQGTEPLLDQGKLDEVLERLPRAYDKVRTLEDRALYQWLVFRVADVSGSQLVAADALDSIEPVINYLPDDLLIPALEEGITLAVANGELQKAQNYISWVKANESLKTTASYARLMQKVDESERAIAARLASPDPITVKGRSFHPYWSHALSHHEFALGAVEIEREDEQGTLQSMQGELKSVQVRCRNRSAQYLDVMLDSGYKIPVAWEDCFVVVEAEVGTSFMLTEYPSVNP